MRYYSAIESERFSYDLFSTMGIDAGSDYTGFSQIAGSSNLGMTYVNVVNFERAILSFHYRKVHCV